MPVDIYSVCNVCVYGLQCAHVHRWLLMHISFNHELMKLCAIVLFLLNNSILFWCTGKRKYVKADLEWWICTFSTPIRWKRITEMKDGREETKTTKKYYENHWSFLFLTCHSSGCIVNLLLSTFVRWICACVQLRPTSSHTRKWHTKYKNQI